MNAPSPIQMIKDKIGVRQIKSLDDISKVNQFVFSIVPVPLVERMRTKLKNIKLQQLPRYFNLWENLKPDASGYYGNWCGFHSRLLVMILKGVYGINKCSIWGYGFRRVVNHVAVMVIWKGTRYTFDPYFGFHYAFIETGEHIPFNVLKGLLKNRRFGDIKIEYANEKYNKNVMKQLGKSQDEHVWDKMGSKQFYDHILALFKKAGSERQLKHKFGHTQHIALMLLS